MKMLPKLFLSASICLCMVQLATAQIKSLPKGNYVVVAAYSPKQGVYAEKYTSYLKTKELPAAYGLAEKKNMIFVYLAEIQDFDQAVSEMLKTRENENFQDAWVFVNKYGSEGLDSSESTSEEIAGATEIVKETDNIVTQTETADIGIEDSKTETETHITQVVSDSTEEQVADEADEPETTEPPKEVTELSQIGFKVNLFNAQTGAKVDGSVDIIDTERAKRIQQIKSSNVERIINPDNGTGKLSVIVDNFGFRKQQKEINFLNPLTDTSQPDISYSEGIYEVDFELVRYSAGDFVVMYNVAFFKDAAVMRPESKFEIKSLMEMMDENPDMRIRIHGHVNGKHPGKIISKGEETDYYTLSDLNKEGVGSAKELSKKRAELIRDLLIDNGVNENRMEIKAWGGKRMIHDKNSTRADENVRVEIEILED